MRWRSQHGSSLLGLTFDGSTYDEGFATIDCYVDWNHPDDELTGFVSEDGIVFFFPMGNRRYRVIADGPMHKADDPANAGADAKDRQRSLRQCDTTEQSKLDHMVHDQSS